jgi:hypothetical protein
VNLYVATSVTENNAPYPQIDEIYASGAPTAAVAATDPSFFAVNGQGDIYYPAQSQGIDELTPGSSTPVEVTNAYVSSIAVDSPGDLLYMEVHAYAPTEDPIGSQSTVSVWGSQCQSFTPPSECYASQNNDSLGAAFGPGVSVFWNDSGAGRVVEVPNNGGPQSNFATGLNLPMALSVDQAGDVFVIEDFQTVIEFSPGGTPKELANGLSDATSLACDATGDLFVSETGANRVLEFPANGSPGFTLVNVKRPHGLAVAAWEPQAWRP